MIRTHVLLHLVALACLGVVPVVVIAGDPVPVGVRPATGVISTQTVPPASATPAHRGVLLRDGPGIGTSAEATYREKWAVVIGVNYTAEDRDPAWGAWSLPLANAENDATNVREMLVKYYGYKPECVRFLTGRAAKNPPPPTADHGAARGATAAEIDNALGAGFLCGDAVQEEDSVLVFFSGHGFLRYDLTRTKSSVYLAPADMRMQANGTPNFDLAAIRMDEVVGKLRDHCRAKHKLLILDCCFSGSVFRIGVGMKGARLGDHASPEELFRQRGFQAITAGQDHQRVLDGPQGGNSPFTASLLRGLTAIPQRGTGSPQPFSASELFRTIDGNLHTIRSDRQSPEYGWIGEDQGEFFFHPTTQAGVTWPRQTRELDSVGQKQLLAIIPSTMGNWWADEMIWFMPALRHEIIVREPKMRSTEQYFDIEAIRRIALERAADHKANYKEDSAREEHFRYDHLHRLLHAKTLKEQVAVIDLIIQQLECRYPQPATEDPGRDAMAERALDLHYLAVLYHVRKRASEARACYERALAEYKVAAEQKPNLRPLYALCQMDYGVLCQTILNQFADARSHFAAAREIAEGRPPAPFVAFTLYKEAEAARRMGAFGVSDRCMKSACDQMIDIDAERAHPMTGAVLKYNAWACMEQCRFEQARQSFEASRQVFQKLLTRNPNSANYQIELFHIQHGLAMIERFQGRDEEAIRMFRGLTEDIAATVQSLDNSGDLLANFAETRQLYAERYVNSVDRQGDCRLYGAIPDYTEAADDYRRALRAVPNIPEGRREAITLDLLYRRAIALAMPASANNPNQNLTLAKLLCDQAASLEEQLVKKYSVYPLLRKTAINKAIAHTLIHNPATAAENELWNLIHPTFDSASPILGENSRDSVRLPLATKELDRDEIERLMFGCTLLLRNWKQWGLTELDALTCCDHLRAACRSATRPARLAGRAIDTGLLKNLRPFYDEMFQFKAELSPPPVKELVEIAWEATRGASYRKPKEIAPILVFYRTVPRGRAPSGYLLLDVTATPGQPGGITQCHLLDEEWCDENTLNRASTSGSSLPLPRGLARVLAGLQYEAPLECRWRDPVTGLGIPQVPTNGEWTNNYALGGLVPVPVAFPQATSLLDRHYFPFNLGAVLPSERFSDRADGLALGIAARSAPTPSEQIPHMRPALPTIPAPGRP